VSAGQRRLNRRLFWWTVVVAFMSVVAYASQLTSGPPPEDVAYRWESSIFGGLQYAILLGIVLLLTRGFDRRGFLALRRPRSWWRAAGISALVVFITFVVTAVVAQFGNADEEQGLIPESFDSSRAAQFAGFATIVVVVAPIMEELMFRGAGYGLLERFGRLQAAVLVGLAFALVHGLLIGFPVIATFGIGLAILRGRTDSIYPCILLHSAFNAFGLAVGIATGS
jgi:membrane protease YdiL (CAAX protease family)